MPLHVVSLIVRGLNRLKKPVKDSKVVVLGVSYKKNTGDIRNTPSEVIIHELKKMEARVYAYDPYVSAEETEKKGAYYAELPEIFREADCIVLATDHDAFKGIKLEGDKRVGEERMSNSRWKRILQQNKS
jgi:UDP-N-acetyl-D-mannosaminuronate dehydrogenase